MNRKTFTTFLMSGLLVALAASPAQAKPDFTGDWKLVADKSDFGPMPAPEKLEQKVKHTDPELKVTTTQVSQQGEMTAELTYSTDGKETVNKFRDNPMKTTAKWDGDTLTMSSKIDFQGNEITLNDTWVLTEEGKTLTVSRKIATPQGEFETKIVMAKQ